MLGADDAVAAEPLGGIKRLVGRPEQAVRMVVALAGNMAGDPDTQGHAVAGAVGAMPVTMTSACQATAATCASPNSFLTSVAAFGALKR